MALTLALLSMTGIPPLIGFTAKFALFAAAIDAGFAWLAVLAVINTVISLFYYLRVISPMCLAAPRAVPPLLDRSSCVAAAISTTAIAAAGLGAQVLFAAVLDARLLP